MCFSLDLSCKGLCTSWTWLPISFPMLGKFSTITSSEIFSVPFYFSSSTGTPITWMLVYLILSQMSLRLSSILFFPFPLFCSSPIISAILSSSLLICSSVSVILLLFPSRVFLFSIAKSLQLCPTLCDPVDGSPPGSPIPGILQARVLEWVAISFSKGILYKEPITLRGRRMDRWAGR